MAHARVVSGGDALGSDLPGGVQQLVELHVIVAKRAGDGGASLEVIVNERADDGLLELALEIDHVIGDAEVLGDAARVVDVVDGAAAMLPGGLGVKLVLKLRQAALVPELHGEAYDRLAAVVQDGGDGGAVDTAAHGHGNGGGGRRCGFASSFEFSDCRHSGRSFLIGRLEFYLDLSPRGNFACGVR